MKQESRGENGTVYGFTIGFAGTGTAKWTETMIPLLYRSHGKRGRRKWGLGGGGLRRKMVAVGGGALQRGRGEAGSAGRGLGERGRGSTVARGDEERGQGGTDHTWASV